MSLAVIHVGDVGTTIRLTILNGDGDVVDVSTATLLMYLRNPKNKLLTKTAVVTNTGTDGKIEYVTVAGDITVAGEWRVQAHVQIATNGWYSTQVPMKVEGNLPQTP